MVTYLIVCQFLCPFFSPFTLPAAMASSSAASMHSIGNQIGYKVRNLAQMGRPMVDIQLKDAHGAHGSYVTSYSTMDRIEGIVSVMPVSDVRFDNIEIAFIGLWIPDYSIIPSQSFG